MLLTQTKGQDEDELANKSNSLVGMTFKNDVDFDYLGSVRYTYTQWRHQYVRQCMTQEENQKEHHYFLFIVYLFFLVSCMDAASKIWEKQSV